MWKSLLVLFIGVSAHADPFALPPDKLRHVTEQIVALDMQDRPTANDHAHMIMATNLELRDHGRPATRVRLAVLTERIEGEIVEKTRAFQVSRNDEDRKQLKYEIRILRDSLNVYGVRSSLGLAQQQRNAK